MLFILIVDALLVAFQAFEFVRHPNALHVATTIFNLAMFLIVLMIARRWRR